MKILLIRNQAIVLLMLFTLSACSMIAIFSQKAYEQATSLKVDALAIMDKASEPFLKHQSEVEVLRLNIDKAYEYAKGRPKNDETTHQWEIIKNPSRNSLGGFLKRWEEDSILSAQFINEAKGIVSNGFDAVIGLESGKSKSTEGQKQ